VAASLKSKKEAVDACLAGAQHITVPLDVLMAFGTHPLSEQTIEQFNVEGVGL
jgi:transaldolase